MVGIGFPIRYWTGSIKGTVHAMQSETPFKEGISDLQFLLDLKVIYAAETKNSIILNSRKMIICFT